MNKKNFKKMLFICLLTSTLLSGCKAGTDAKAHDKVNTEMSDNKENNSNDSSSILNTEVSNSESDKDVVLENNTSDTHIEIADETVTEKVTEKEKQETTTPLEQNYFVPEGSYAQTIMIYMVGSDLESSYASGSLDLSEIIDAEVNTAYNNIVVYTGGASAWYMEGLSSESDNIILLDGENFNTVESTEPKNMGESSTLSSFINFCMDNYESETYSLILWNHGAGPVFGYGLDENNNDILSLMELKQALEESIGMRAEQCLEWIGFDACLMNSMEIADVVAPYAKYMLASQETEPGWGWCYYFLNMLSNEVMKNAQLEEVIIDTYMYFGELVFEEYPNMYCDLTLSCIDLSKYQTAENAINEYFGELADNLDVSSYSQIVRGRKNARAFGVYSTNYDYGMVDVIHLLEQLPQSELASEAIAAVNDMVIYSSSNMDNVHGISICYPLESEDNYTDSYLDIQVEIDFAGKYGEFLRDFYAIKKGEKIADSWEFSKSEMTVTDISTGDDNTTSISEITIQLTEEQQANFSHASYIILCNAKGAGYITEEVDSRAEDMYFLIYHGKDVSLNENGILHTNYGNQAIYIYDKTNDMYSDVPMLLFEKDRTKDEIRYTVFGVLQDMGGDSIADWRVETAEIQVVVNAENPNGIIRYAIPYNNANEIISPNKQLLDLNDFTYLGLASAARYYTRGEDGQMINFDEWEDAGRSMGIEIELQNEFSLEARPLDDIENYSCIFMITDLQGNVSYSEMIPLK